MVKKSSAFASAEVRNLRCMACMIFRMYSMIVVAFRGSSLPLPFRISSSHKCLANAA